MSQSSRAIPVLLAAATTQFAAAVGFWSFGLLAPDLAAETGLEERDFGLSITFTFLGAFLASPFTGAFVRRFGGQGTVARMLAILVGALALTLTGTWTGAMLAAFLFGIGYGPQGAVGMTLVTQTAAPRRRGLFLALRHSAVPLAAGIVGRALPPLMLVAGWQAGVLSVMGVLGLALVFTLLAGALFRVEAAPPGPAQSLVRRFRTVFQIPPGLRFLWSIGMVFALTQTAVTMFSYLYLLEVAELSAVAAGVFVSNLHLTALIGRPVLGWLTDRTGDADRVLAMISVVTVLAIAALLQVGPETPLWMLMPLAVACGISGQCWNSVFVTAMSFRVGSGDLAELNGRAFAFLSLGWMASPPIIWGLIELTGSYGVPLTGLAVLNAAAALLLFARPRAVGAGSV
ncbi:MAG: MFS transporter [Pseudomonadota bacterium]